MIKKLNNLFKSKKVIIASMVLLVIIGGISVKNSQKTRSFLFDTRDFVLEYALQNFKLRLYYVEKFDETEIVLNEKAYKAEFINIYPRFNHYIPFSRSFFDDDGESLYWVTADGVFAYMPLTDLTQEGSSFISIPSNITEYLRSDWTLSIRGVLVDDNQIFIAHHFGFPSEKSKLGKCVQKEVLVADINLKKLNFKKLFVEDRCDDILLDYLHRPIPLTQIEDSVSGIGGKIVSYKDNKILFSVGDMIGNPQTDDNTYGKIIAIDKQTGDYEIISKGHRNQQGLHYDAVQDVIISTEHGPQGGDEININLKPGGDEIENYGWPIASYGWPYSMDPETDINPFKSPHTAYGFIEPMLYFTPAIGIAQILKVDERFNSLQGTQLFVAALSGSNPDPEAGGHGVTHYILDDDYNVVSRDVAQLEGRIRDLMYIEKLNKIIAYREDDQTFIIISAKE